MDAAGAPAARSRYTMVARVQRRDVEADPGGRAPTPRDAPAIAELMLSAYRGTIDDEGETAEETLDVVRQLLAGDPVVRLAVTRGNAPAERLYASFGFVPEAAEPGRGRGGTWAGGARPQPATPPRSRSRPAALTTA